LGGKCVPLLVKTGKMVVLKTVGPYGKNCLATGWQTCRKRKIGRKRFDPKQKRSLFCTFSKKKGNGQRGGRVCLERARRQE